MEEQLFYIDQCAVSCVTSKTVGYIVSVTSLEDISVIF